MTYQIIALLNPIIGSSYSANVMVLNDEDMDNHLNTLLDNRNHHGLYGSSNKNYSPPYKDVFISISLIIIPMQSLDIF